MQLIAENGSAAQFAPPEMAREAAPDKPALLNFEHKMGNAYDPTLPTQDQRAQTCNDPCLASLAGAEQVEA